MHSHQKLIGVPWESWGQKALLNSSTSLPFISIKIDYIVFLSLSLCLRLCGCIHMCIVVCTYVWVYVCLYKYSFL